MKYQQLLYSRSKSCDYRWLIVPSNVSPVDLKTLKQLFDLFYRNITDFNKNSVTPLYCLNLPQATYLVTCGLFNRKDQHGRDIYYLQGISVASNYRRQFLFLLPWLLAARKRVLNVWKEINFENADTLKVEASAGYSLEIAKLDRQLPSSSFGLDDLANESVNLTFDESGFGKLKKLLSSPFLPLMNFAFGATPEMLQVFDSFRIVVPIKDHSSGNIVTSQRYSSRNSLFPSKEPQFVEIHLAQEIPFRSKQKQLLDSLDPRKQEQKEEAQGWSPEKNSPGIFKRLISKVIPGVKPTKQEKSDR